MRDGQNRVLARKFEEFAGKKLKRDRIAILRDGDLNVLEGTLGEVNAKDKTVQFKSEANGTLVNIPLERLHGMIFFRPDVVAEPAMCKVLDIDGNMLIASKLAHDGTKLIMTTTLGNQLTLPAEVLAKLDFNMGKLTYLSDLEPAKVIEKSGIGLVNRFRRDVNLDGEPIMLEGNTYAKGLSLHAYTELEYNLAGKYKEFKAILGVDVRTGSDSQAKVDHLLRWRRSASPRSITAKQAAAHRPEREGRDDAADRGSIARLPGPARSRDLRRRPREPVRPKVLLTLRVRKCTPLTEVQGSSRQTRSLSRDGKASLRLSGHGSLAVCVVRGGGNATNGRRTQSFCTLSPRR